MCISKNMQTHILAGSYLKSYGAFSNSKHIKCLWYDLICLHVGKKIKWHCVPSWKTLLMETFFPWATFLCVQASKFFLKFSLGSKHLKSANRTKPNWMFFCPWLSPHTGFMKPDYHQQLWTFYHLREKGKCCLQQSQGGVFCRWSNRRAKITWWRIEWPYHEVFATQKRSLGKRSATLLLGASTIAAGTWTSYSSARHVVEPTELKMCIPLLARGRNPEQLQGSLQWKIELQDIAWTVTKRKDN